MRVGLHEGVVVNVDDGDNVQLCDIDGLWENVPDTVCEDDDVIVGEIDGDSD